MKKEHPLTKSDHARRYSDAENPHTKPKVTLTKLIGLALLEAPGFELSVSGIYAWIEDNYPYYKYTKTGWKNSIRHAMSLHEAFEPYKTGSYSRGNYWHLREWYQKRFRDGDFRNMKQYPKRSRANSNDVSNLKSPAPVIPDPSNQIFFGNHPELSQSMVNTNFALNQSGFMPPQTTQPMHLASNHMAVTPNMLPQSAHNPVTEQNEAYGVPGNFIRSQQLYHNQTVSTYPSHPLSIYSSQIVPTFPTQTVKTEPNQTLPIYPGQGMPTYPNQTMPTNPVPNHQQHMGPNTSHYRTPQNYPQYPNTFNTWPYSSFYGANYMQCAPNTENSHYVNFSTASLNNVNCNNVNVNNGSLNNVNYSHTNSNTNDMNYINQSVPGPSQGLNPNGYNHF